MKLYLALFYAMLLVNVSSLNGMNKAPCTQQQVCHLANIFEKLHAQEIKKSPYIRQEIEISESEALVLKWALKQANGHLAYSETYSIRKEKNAYKLVRYIGFSHTQATKEEINSFLRWKWV